MAQILAIEGKTRELGRLQNFRPLPVRDEFVTFPENPLMALHIMITSWELDPDEMERLLAGGSIELRIYGAMMPADNLSLEMDGHPPVLITVGEPPILETYEDILNENLEE